MKLSRWLRATYYSSRNIDKLDYTPKDTGVIVSFTTVPSRIQQIKPTIISLLNQTVRPTQIELNLAKSPQKNDIDWDVPAWLSNLQAVKIIWLEHDYGPASKYIPTLLRHKKDNPLVVIVDDDMIYSKSLVQRFVDADNHSGERIVFCSNGHPITHDHIFFSDISDKAIKQGTRRVAIIEGCGGYCIRPQFFDLDALINYSDLPNGAIRMDDIWISGHLSRQKIKKLQIPSAKRHSLPQAQEPAITGPRADISNQLLDYFSNDWADEEYYE